MNTYTNIPKYQPSPTIRDWVQDAKIIAVPGLSGFVAKARAAGYQVAIDLGDGEVELEEIHAGNAKLAVNEVEDARIYLLRDGLVQGWIYVIPSNGDDWLVDYSYSEWLEKLLEEV